VSDTARRMGFIFQGKGFGTRTFLRSVARPKYIGVTEESCCADGSTMTRSVGSDLAGKDPFFAVSLHWSGTHLQGPARRSAVADPICGAPSSACSSPRSHLDVLAKLFIPVHLGGLPAAGHLGARSLRVLAAPDLVFCASIWYLAGGTARSSSAAFFFINIVLVLPARHGRRCPDGDRYTYPLTSVYASLWRVAGEPAVSPARGSGAKPIVADFFLMLPVCLVQTWNRCRVWQDSETSWNDTIRNIRARSWTLLRPSELLRQEGTGSESSIGRTSIKRSPSIPRYRAFWYNRGVVLAHWAGPIPRLLTSSRREARAHDFEALNNRGA